MLSAAHLPAPPPPPPPPCPLQVFHVWDVTTSLTPLPSDFTHAVGTVLLFALSGVFFLVVLAFVLVLFVVLVVFLVVLALVVVLFVVLVVFLVVLALVVVLLAVLVVVVVSAGGWCCGDFFFFCFVKKSYCYSRGQ